MPDISEFCPHCGRPVREGNVFSPAAVSPTRATTAAASKPQSAPTSVQPTPSLNIRPAPATVTPAPRPPLAQPPVQWTDRIPGALAYFTFIPALVFLFAQPYQKRKFVRFHALQSLMFWAGVLICAVLGVIASMFGWLFLWLLTGSLIGLALFFTWVLLSIKALQGEWFGLPVLGPFAEQRSGR